MLQCSVYTRELHREMGLHQGSNGACAFKTSATRPGIVGFVGKETLGMYAMPFAPLVLR